MYVGNNSQCTVLVIAMQKLVPSRCGQCLLFSRQLKQMSAAISFYGVHCSATNVTLRRIHSNSSQNNNNNNNNQEAKRNRFAKTSTPQHLTSSAHSRGPTDLSGVTSSAQLHQACQVMRNDIRRGTYRSDILLRTLSSLSIARVHDMDAASVALCLQLLVLLDAPRETALITEAASWLCVHARMQPHIAAQALQHLLTLKCATLHQVERALRDQGSIVAAADKASYPVLAAFFAASVRSRSQKHSAAPQDLNEISQTLRSAVMGGLADLSFTDILMILTAYKDLDRALLLPGEAFAMATLWGRFADGDSGAALSLLDHIALAHCARQCAAPVEVQQHIVTRLMERMDKQLVQHRETNVLELSVNELVKSLVFIKCEALADSQVVKGEDVRRMKDALTGIVQRDLKTLPVDDAFILCVKYCELLLLPGLEEPCCPKGEGQTEADMEESQVPFPDFITAFLSTSIAVYDSKLWTSRTVGVALRVLTQQQQSTDPLALQLADKYFKSMEKEFASGSSTPLQPSDFTCLFVPGVVETFVDQLSTAIMAHVDMWNVAQVVEFLQRAAPLPGKATRKIMREAATVLTKYVDRASAEQVSALMRYYGMAGVRNDGLCSAIAQRLQKLISEVSFSQLADILVGFASVEYRSTKPFADASNTVMALLAAGDGTPETVASTMGAYSKMLIWNFPVIWALASRLAEFGNARRDGNNLTLRTVAVGQLALIRMDVEHADVAALFLEHVKQAVGGDNKPNQARLSQQEYIMLLSILSRTPLVIRGEADVDVQDACVALAARIEAFADELDAHAVAEVLLSLSRLRLSDHPLFEKLSLCTLGLVPQAPPIVLSYFISAYAKAGRSDAELFSLVADRVIAMKDRIAAVTIASILESFATAGVADDKLFIEAIPRVRHVGLYGTPKDISNVVYAYARAKIWHYKLFARLADRAVQLRSEYPSAHVVRLLEAFAVVGMRYDKLFIEFSPRVQTLAHLLTPAETASIANSYATLYREALPVFGACASQAAAHANNYSAEEARQLLDALSSVGFTHPTVVTALAKTFPHLMEEYKSIEAGHRVQSSDGDAETPTNTGGSRA